MIEQDNDTRVQSLLEQFFEGLTDLKKLEPTLLKDALLCDLQVILSYLPSMDRRQLLSLLSKKSDGLALSALERLARNPSGLLPVAMAHSLLSDLETYQRQQSFDALFTQDAIADLCAILEKGQ